MNMRDNTTKQKKHDAFPKDETLTPSLPDYHKIYPLKKIFFSFPIFKKTMNTNVKIIIIIYISRKKEKTK